MGELGSLNGIWKGVFITGKLLSLSKETKMDSLSGGVEAHEPTVTFRVALKARDPSVTPSRCDDSILRSICKVQY